ncbi:hypothetical protein KFL_001070080 [Klebsormidium nitens]|uniref:Uncharacterized protein n=1 Tax=Klebsormidium nitens TaxID=105231 RepID=A0A1Y1HWZ4_KLENI|nr:hypothetical protein KFL_001070080 [Klebsormidium nitens]|eukprot:GAQ82302.1 hypothetical protein KFL_001070080 [Klebsormidium nitens]
MSLFSSLPPAGKRDGQEKRAPQAIQKVPLLEETTDDAAQAKGDGGAAGREGASPDAVISAMAKIAAHIDTAKKFSKASKLALQLLEAGSVNRGNAGQFFEILERAMETPANSNDLALREDYRALFSAAEERKSIFSEAQQARLEVWLLQTVLANELHTDDTFQFSRLVGKVKEILEALPQYAEGDELPAGPPLLEYGQALPEPSAAPLEGFGPGLLNSEPREALDEPGVSRGDSEEGAKKKKRKKVESPEDDDPFGLESMLPGTAGVESDPFGLEDMIPKEVRRKEEKAKRKREEEERFAREEAEGRRLLAGRRAAVMACLRAAESQYKYTWAKTTVEILIKLAFDNLARFTPPQQAEIESLWTTVRNEQIRRKQGKAGTHKLGKQEVTSYERAASKWAGEKISIRSAVGGEGDGSTVTWLG